MRASKAVAPAELTHAAGHSVPQVPHPLSQSSTQQLLRCTLWHRCTSDSRATAVSVLGTLGIGLGLRPYRRGRRRTTRLARLNWAIRAASNGSRPGSSDVSEDPLDMAIDELVTDYPYDGRKIGVLLLNIGTPASTSVEDVRTYLEQFLADERVIDLQPALLKWIVLQAILQTRPAASAANYKKIWDPVRGSPLLFHSQDLAKALQLVLGKEFEVRIGMQYSEPLVGNALKDLAMTGVDNVVLVPMFPHYASGTTGGCLATAYRTAADLYCTPFLSVLPPFYSHPAYVSAMRQSISEVVGQRGQNVDHLLFSFHGLPEEQCSRTDTTGKFCNRSPDCCNQLRQANRNCYRAQCLETARLLAYELGLAEGGWSIGFQSRLTLRGTVQWIRPYTDEAFVDLARRGVKRLAVVAPSFTADCVETLEELGLTGRQQFAEAGGEELVLVPCLNSSELWARNLAQIVREHVAGRSGGRERAEPLAGLAPPQGREQLPHLSDQCCQQGGPVL